LKQRHPERSTTVDEKLEAALNWVKQGPACALVSYRPIDGRDVSVV
jgi:hypothetical protein